jgi:peptidyl-prolyl cis-trans isomerase D
LLDKAKLQADAKAKQIAVRLKAGETLQAVAAEQKLEIKKVTGFTRDKTDLPPQLADAVFKAPKPVGDKPSVTIVPLPTGEQVILSVTKETAGSMSEDDKKKMELAKKNIANAFGQNEFSTVLNSLQSRADISIKLKPQDQTSQQ